MVVVVVVVSAINITGSIEEKRVESFLAFHLTVRMEVAYVYTKTRAEFGKQCFFADGPTEILESILPTDEYDDSYVQRNPRSVGVCTAPPMSESEVNTERVTTTNSSMLHVEGGWPKDVDATEQSDVARYRKKAEKDEEYQYAIKMLGPVVMKCMRENNTVNLYEEYFAGDGAASSSSSDGADGNGEAAIMGGNSSSSTGSSTSQHRTEAPSAKGVAVFRDPSGVRRTASSIDWHPEGSRIAVSYSILNFQDKRLIDPDMSSSAYIWDITNSNSPLVELLSPSPLTCLRFNPKSSDTLVGGCYNGLIVYFDLRKPNAPAGKCKPLSVSVIEKSHHDPVGDVFWVQSKTGHQCASVSTDGQLLWWDTRNLEAPIDSIPLPKSSQSSNSDDSKNLTLGGSSLEYNTEAGPTKYLVGTDQGIPLSINLRQRKSNNGITILESRGSNNNGQHHGAVRSIQRNPMHTKFFLTVGDWTAKIWSEDIKTPIVTTRYHDAYATSGCWSPTRPGVFYITRMDGAVDIWDLYHSHGEVTYSHKVSDVALSAVSVQGSTQSGGKLVAVGDINGTVSLLEVCNSLSKLEPNEKASLGNMLDREARREKNLEIRDREEKRAKAVEESRLKKEKEILELADEDGEDLLLKAEVQFFSMIKEGEAERSKVG